MTVLRVGRVSVVVRRRPLLATLGVAALILVLSVFALGSGSFPLTPLDVIDALLGRADPRTHLVVMEWRLPRLVAAIVFGAALGASGAAFQSLARNPLGSPDILGFESGAVAGALAAILLVGFGQVTVTAGALAGGLGTAAIVTALGLRGGRTAGVRLVIVGIAVSTMLTSINQLIIMRASLEQAYRASSWSLGSVAEVGWSQLAVAGPAVGVLVLALWLLARPARMVELHHDAAAAFGVSPKTVRIGLIVVGVGLVAVPTSVAGPVTFVALAAPHLARRLTRVPALAVVSPAAMGAALLLAADVAVQNIPTTSALPVGVGTLVLGGAYFAWLLVRGVVGRR